MQNQSFPFLSPNILNDPYESQSFLCLYSFHSTRVGVFFCGPEGLSDVLEKCSHEHSNIGGNGAKFIYNKENF